jgi:hypothetical protein
MKRQALPLIAGVSAGVVVGGFGFAVLAVPITSPPPSRPEVGWPAAHTLHVEITDEGLDPEFLHADQGRVAIDVTNARRTVESFSITGVTPTVAVRPGETEAVQIDIFDGGTYELRSTPAPARTPAARGILLVGPPRIGGHVDAGHLGAGTPIEAIHHRERQVGAAYTLHRLYFRWNDELPSPSLIETLEEGRTALVSWNSIGSGLSWAQIAAGRGDARIREVGEALVPVAQAFPGRLFFAWHHEPEVHVRLARRHGIVETGTGPEFAASWQRVFRIFGQQGFDPMRALVSDEYSPEFTQGVEFDVLAPDKYPWSPLTPDGRCSRRWATFDEVWEAMRSMFAERFPEKSVLIGETGAQERRHPVCQPRGDPRAKARWLRESLPVIWEWVKDPTNPLFGVGVFDSGAFRVDTSSASLGAWADLVDALQPSLVAGTTPP